MPKVTDQLRGHLLVEVSGTYAQILLLISTRVAPKNEIEEYAQGSINLVFYQGVTRLLPPEVNTKSQVLLATGASKRPHASKGSVLSSGGQTSCNLVKLPSIKASIFNPNH
jgi:hypothetical protein